jgi:hypothetical protein
LIELLLGLVDVLAYPGPQLHLLIVTKPIVAGPRTITGHICVEEDRKLPNPAGSKVGTTRGGIWGIDDWKLGEADRGSGGDKPKAVGVRRAPRVGARAVVLYFQRAVMKEIII